MKWFNALTAFAASLVFAVSIAAWAEKPPSTQPSDSRSDRSDARAARGARWGFAPYNRLTSVTEEQKEKISEIHRKANAERKAIDQKEEEEVMALLTDEQKAELEKIEADRKAAAKARAADRKADKKDKDEDEKDK